MSGLRQLALCYLVVALAFVLGAVAASHPDIGYAARDVARRAEAALRDAPELFSTMAQSDARVRIALDAPDPAPTQVRIALAPPGPNDGRTLAHAQSPPMKQARIIDMPPPGTLSPPDPGFAPEPIIIAPDLDSVPADRPTPRVAEESAPEPSSGMTPEQARARARLAASLTPEMRTRFGLFLFISKAEKGPLAQRMYVFRKEDGDLKLAYDWAASTGREQDEIDPGGRRTVTATPGGLYQLDPGRMYVRYHSTTWDQDMPYAMFFNWQREGLQTGLAIHAATGADIDRLGQRASAGCVHLSPQNARILFNLIQDQYRGAVPRFAIDGNDTMSNKGRFARNSDGSLRLASGYRVLIDIENFGGGSGDKVAALF